MLLLAPIGAPKPVGVVPNGLGLIPNALGVPNAVGDGPEAGAPPKRPVAEAPPKGEGVVPKILGEVPVNPIGVGPGVGVPPKGLGVVPNGVGVVPKGLGVILGEVPAVWDPNRPNPLED